ncbi:MAG: cupin domain-containing protein [Geminicoccaceae bacterium]
MKGFVLQTSVPRLYGASAPQEDLVDWGPQPDAVEGASHSSGRLLFKGPGNRPEVGLWRCTPGRWRLAFPADEVCHFVQGHAVYRGENGEVIEAGPGTFVHFKEGWRGEAQVTDTIQVLYMLTEGGPAERTPMLRDPLHTAPLTDWGVVPTMIEGASHMSGVLLSREPDRRAESGIWVCTPGYWRCEVDRGEYCHFLAGRCTYTADDGEVIEILPDTFAWFGDGWKGTCRVHETVRKVYMIR